MLFSILCVFWILNYTSAQFTTDDILRNIKCHENRGSFCNSIVCAKLNDDDCPNGEVVPNSSFCNCCDACIETLDQGRSCEKTIEGTLKNIIQPRCKKGLQCIDGICSMKDTTCRQETKFRLDLRSKSVFSPDLWVPECAKDGNYSSKQTKTKRSFCVDSNGKRIFGLLNSMFSENMTCGCSRDYEKRRGQEDFLSEPQIHCSPSGDYDEVQCIGDSCYCADPYTGAVKSKIVKIKYLEILPCSWKKSGKSKSKPKGYIKPCEVEIIRIQKLKSYFRKKGLAIEYTDPVNCDPDGTFHPVQCNSEICSCTNTEGLGIGSFFVNKRDKPSNMTCSCARDSIVSEYAQLDCKGYGNYEPIHCFSADKCYCVDKDGDLISKELSQKQAKSICDRAVKTLQTRVLKDLEETVITTTTTDGTIEDQTDYVYDE